MLVFGERGSGKTSFTEMIKMLASGNTELLYRHQFHKKFPPQKLKYKIVSFTCNEGAKTTAKVLQNLITNPHGIKQSHQNCVNRQIISIFAVSMSNKQ